MLNSTQLRQFLDDQKLALEFLQQNYSQVEQKTLASVEELQHFCLEYFMQKQPKEGKARVMIPLSIPALGKSSIISKALELSVKESQS